MRESEDVTTMTLSIVPDRWYHYFWNDYERKSGTIHFNVNTFDPMQPSPEFAYNLNHDVYHAVVRFDSRYITAKKLVSCLVIKLIDCRDASESPFHQGIYGYHAAIVDPKRPKTERKSKSQSYSGDGVEDNQLELVLESETIVREKYCEEGIVTVKIEIKTKKPKKEKTKTNKELKKDKKGKTGK